MDLTTFIKRLENINSLSKHEQLISGIMEAIDTGFLKVGSQLPSINVMVDEIGFARKTIVKSYEELKERGLVESKKNKGYFIISSQTKNKLRIALLMYSFQRFQEEFYNTMRHKLGDEVQIDVFFHHNNPEVFETIFSNVFGKYGMYVVAPIENDRTAELLKTISPEKLIVVDRYLNLGSEYSYVTQEFEESTYQYLDSLLPQIQRYKEITLYFREDRDYPRGILNSFLKFIGDKGLNGSVKIEYKPQTVEKGRLYMVISDSELWDLLKDCRNNEHQLGSDIGILSFNEHVFKELVFDGITTISTDFNEMARAAAQLIDEKQQGKIVVPTTLRKRNSL